MTTSLLIAAWSESSALRDDTTRVMARRRKKEHNALYENLNHSPVFFLSLLSMGQKNASHTLADPQKPNVLPSSCLRLRRGSVSIMSLHGDQNVGARMGEA